MNAIPEWIWRPENTSREENSFVVFRKTVDLAVAPREAILRIAADSRYRLVVNDRIVGVGPHMTDAGEASVDSYDIASYLVVGANAVEATVQHLGADTLSYVPGDPGLYCSIDIDGNRNSVVTGSDWQCRLATERRQDVPKRNWALGFPEYVDLGAVSDDWRQAETVSSDSFGRLFNRPIPPLKLRKVSPEEITTIWTVSADSPGELEDASKSLTAYLDEEEAVEWWGPNATRNLPRKDGCLVFDFSEGDGFAFCIDCGRERTGHPFFNMVSDSGGTVQMCLAELLQDDSRRPWNNRRDCRCASQVVMPPGEHSWTAWDYSGGRYVYCVLRGFEGKVKVRSVGLLSRHADYTEQARFVSDDALLNRIWSMGAETAELCSQDLLVDCPTREQGQYAGDIYVMAPIMMYCYGDVSYCKEGVRQGFMAQDEDGIIPARFPTGIPQTLYDYSLMPAMLLHEYYLFTGDAGFVEQQLDCALKSLDAFRKRLGKSGCIELNGVLDYDKGIDCHFIDHPGLGWHDFDYPGLERNGISAAFNFFYILAARGVAELCGAAGRNKLAEQLISEADAISKAARDLFWMGDTECFADVLTPEGSLQGFSQQTNALAMLAGIVSDEMAERMLPRILDESNPDLCRCTPYFYHFLFKALRGRGKEAEVLEIIRNRWGGMIEKGATSTWEAFDGGPKDSLCHAWSAAPTHFLLSDYVGVRIAEPGFAKVTVCPRFDLFAKMDAAVATPEGALSVAWEKTEEGAITCLVEVPNGLRVAFESDLCDEPVRELKGGMNKIACYVKRQREAR